MISENDGGGGGGGKGCLELLKTHLFWYHIHHPSLSSFWTVLLFGDSEAEKTKTFRVATFYTQKLSGRSARNHFS